MSLLGALSVLAGSESVLIVAHHFWRDHSILQVTVRAESWINFLRICSPPWNSAHQLSKKSPQKILWAIAIQILAIFLFTFQI